MSAPRLFHDLLLRTAGRVPDAPAVTEGAATLAYGALAAESRRVAGGLRALGLRRSERVGVFMEKRHEAVVADFAATLAGGAFVPLNPVLKPYQVQHVLRDCEVSFLVTTAPRLDALAGVLGDCSALRGVVVVGPPGTEEASGGPPATPWDELAPAGEAGAEGVVETDVAAILYTSGSTGRPKGVVLSHRNLVAGAESVAEYLGNHGGDTILAALPLSFDAGLSQVTTALRVGARVVLLDYLLPRDVLKALARERVTGLTAVPTLWMQIAELSWPGEVASHLRYIANTGGPVPRATLARLREVLPSTRVFLMYGLTEAFRATRLPPDQVDRRPDSIGRAIPNAEVLVLRGDGTRCEPGEAGELVQRGPLVSLGYWNDPEATAERFRPLPAAAGGRPGEVVPPETVVFSGDVVRADEEGYLYFVGRRDEMIKTSGYRVSPTEVEEVLYGSGLVRECAAIGVPDGRLGQAIEVVVHPSGDLEADALLAHCRRVMPAYLVPARVHVREEPLPKSPNGKIDRRALADELAPSAPADP